MPEPIQPESIEVPASPENGNVPVGEPAAAPAAPTPGTSAAEPAAPASPAEPELYELPDGRKVDAATLAREFKDNFLPEFTRKSQALAELTKPKTGEQLTRQDAPNPLANPEFVPKDYGELAKIIKEDTLRELESRSKAESDARAALENAVAEQLNAVKAVDKTVDENRLFQHAAKYGFTDLRAAHQNMKDMEKAAAAAKASGAKEAMKRADPVSVVPGMSAGGAPNPSAFSSAIDYLRSIRKA